jgi:hypothetical protein
MALSSQKRITRHTNRRLAVIVALVANLSAGAIFAQPADPNATAPGQPPSQNPPSTPPAWQRFEIRQETPAEREAFLKKREEALALHPPREVQPLPAQAIGPPFITKAVGSAMAKTFRLLGDMFKCALSAMAVSVVTSSTAYCGNPTLVAQPGVTAPASISELARALKYDANLIYEYVYTNIEYSPIYGVKKGGLGTLLDGHGNDFDQSALLVALLRQSGYTAGYLHGTIRLSAATIGSWLGVDTSTACPFLNLLGQGGFAVNLSGCNVAFSTADIPHVWVTATGGSLGTTTYVYDPSFKTYTTPTAGINLATVMNYCQTGTSSCFLPQAESGTTITPNSIQNVNSANIHNALAGYANNLVSYIRTNIPTATLKDVIGGKYIQPITQPYTPQTSLPYEKPGDTPTPWTGKYPQHVPYHLGGQYRRNRYDLLCGPDLRAPTKRCL